MEEFFDGLEQAVRDRNWHAALVLSLTLPDICVKASDPTRKTNRTRYAAWFETYVAPAYTRYVGARQFREEIKFLSGRDCYALRCALLHEGSDDTTNHDVREALDSFQFCIPGERGNRNHMNKIDRRLYLMVDTFAQDMLAGARAWWTSVAPEEQAAARRRMLTLQSTDGDLQLG